MNDRRQQIDTSVEIVTPENIAFRYWLAGPARRVPAYLIDLLIQVVVLFLAFWAMGFTFGALGLVGSFFGLYFVVLFLVHWFYGGLLEAVWNGQTVGKRALRIRILRSNGERATLGHIFSRRFLPTTLLGVIPRLGPLVTLADCLLIFRDSRKCLHDQFADTIVVKAE